MLTIHNIEKKFKRKTVLDNLSYVFYPGVYGLLGPNGAGKTTFMRCLTNQYQLNQGSIKFQGNPIHNNAEYLARVGYLPQHFGLFKELKVIDMMLLLANLKGVAQSSARKMAEQCIEIVNLSDVSSNRVATLSGGMIRRLGIAQALLNDPLVIIFDEPTTGLDPEERLRFKNIVRQIHQDKTIIISTHIVEDVEAVCDTITIMNNGRITREGSCADIQALADGKVFWVPEKEQSMIQGIYYLQKQSEVAGMLMQKILSNTPQAFEAALPSVEDGYICELKNI